MARLYTPPPRATTWKIRLAVKWDPVVILPFVQMVGCPLFAPEAMDDSIHRAATKKHYPRFDHTLCVEWNWYLDNGDSVVDEVAKYHIRGNPISCLVFGFCIDERWPNNILAFVKEKQ